MLRTQSAGLALLLTIVVGTSALAAKPKKKPPKKPKPAATQSAAPAQSSAPTSLPPPPPPPPSSEPSGTGASGSAEASGHATGGGGDDESSAPKGSSGSEGGPPEASGSGYITVGALIGGGLGSSPNYYGLGLGLRGGYTLPMKIYFGATFVYHLGTSTVVFASVEQKQNLYYPGVEGGYDLTFGQLLLRPYLGVGVALATGSIGNKSDTTSNFALWPGALVTYSFGSLFVGGDVRFVIPTSLSANALSLFATAGVKF